MQGIEAMTKFIGTRDMIRNNASFMVGIIQRVGTVFDPISHQNTISSLPFSIRRSLQKMYDRNAISPGDLDTKVCPCSPPNPDGPPSPPPPIYEGCRYLALGSCGFKKVEDEDSNLQPQYKEGNCIEF